MQHGRVELFNFKTFNYKSQYRSGSDKDVTDLNKCIKSCSSKSRVTKNTSSLTSLELDQRLSRIANSDFTNVSYFLCFLSSHGDGHGLLTRDMHYFPLSRIIQHFSDENCPSLEGVPKIFIIQACRGTDFDDGYEVDEQSVGIAYQGCDALDLGGIEALTVLSSSEPVDEKLKAIESGGFAVTRSLRALHETMPADCVVALSTPPERYSWRSRAKGGYFTQKLIQTTMEFKDADQPMDIEKILLATNQKLATEFSSQAKEASGKRQIGEFVSTLTKRAYL